MTPEESFCPGIEQLQGSYSFLRRNDSRGVLQSWDGTTPEESFCPGIERLQGSYSLLRWNDMDRDIRTTLEVFVFSYSWSAQYRVTVKEVGNVMTQTRC